MDRLVDQGGVCVKVELTKSQCAAVADLIDVNLLDIIRNDTDIDNLAWVENILSAKRAMEKAVDEYETD